MASSAIALSIGSADAFIKPATAPVIDWESEVGGELILLDPPVADNPDDEEEEEAEEVAVRWGSGGGGAAGVEVEDAAIELGRRGGGAGKDADKLLETLGLLDDGIEPPMKLVLGGKLAPFLIFRSRLDGAT